MSHVESSPSGEEEHHGGTGRRIPICPVATPGVDHAGQLVRLDGVVSLPLRRLRDAGLPGVAEVLGAIGQGL
jgi:hypothetical protein